MTATWQRRPQDSAPPANSSSFLTPALGRFRQLAARLLAALTAALLLVLPALAPASAQEPETLTIVFPEPLPPYAILDPNGGVTGIRADLWAEWSKVTGIPVTLRQGAWADLRQNISIGTADVIDMALLACLLYTSPSPRD